MQEPAPQPDPSPRKLSGVKHFITELRQRNVFKVAVVYGITGWVIIQAVTAVFPAFDFPAWTTQFVIMLVLLGFLITLVIAWAFELTPDGLKKSSEVAPADSIAPQTSRQLNTYIITAMGVLIVFMLVERVFFAGTNAVSATAVVDGSGGSALVNEAISTTAPLIDAALPSSSAISDKSIAVLPLDDFDAGGDEAYFADGLTEEILNALTRAPDLLVASRTSSFQYKDQAVDVQEVAQSLGVAHILEGSVRRSADRLRVTVQLIRASDGFHLWSENYDRTPDDIIAVQEDIAFQIASALQTAMDPEALRQMVQSGTRSVAAYNAYLRGQALAQSIGGSLSREGYDYFELARQTDPGFSRAHARAAGYWVAQLTPNLIRSQISTRETVSPAEMLKLYGDRIKQAIATSVGPEQLRNRMGEARINLQFRAAFGYAEQYLIANPTLTNVGSNEGLPLTLIELARIMGDVELVISLLERASSLPSLNENVAVLIQSHYEAGQFGSGRNLVRTALERYPFNELIKFQSHRLLVSGGFIEEARQILDTVTGAGGLDTYGVQLMRLRQACAEADLVTANQVYAEIGSNWQTLILMGRDQEAAERLRPLDQEGTLYSLSTYMSHSYFDVNQYPNLKAVLEREGVPLPLYQPLSYACPAQNQ